MASPSPATPAATPQFNSEVVMSGAEYFSNAAALNPYMHPEEEVHVERAMQQHGVIAQALERAGVTVIRGGTPENCQDGIFTANWAVTGIDDETVVLGNLPSVRGPEKLHYKPLYERLGKKVLELREDWYFSGQGDALRYGNLLLCGQEYRTTNAKDVHAFLQHNLGYDVVSLKTKGLLDQNGQQLINKATGLPESEFYDIDYAIGIVRWPTKEQMGLLAVCKDAFDERNLEIIQSLPNTKILWTPYEEANGVSACNLVSTGHTVVMNAGAPILSEQIRREGLTVIETENDELKKNGGSVRCTTNTTRHVPDNA